MSGINPGGINPKLPKCGFRKSYSARDRFNVHDWILPILIRMNVGPLAFLALKSFNSSRVFENHADKYFHVVPGQVVIIHVTFEIFKPISYL